MDGQQPAAARAPSARGLWFEDFRSGMRFTTPARTVTEADVVAFTALSGDANPIHTDEVFARRSPFRRRVAHGLLVQSIVTGLAHQVGIFDGTIAAIAEMTIRFEAPVGIGDTVHAELAVTAVDGEPAPRRGSVRFGVRVVDQRGRTISTGEWLALMQRRRRGQE
jgi:acyl dehydratase